MKRAFDLYLITDPETDMVAVTRAALRGAPPGRVAVQLRDKSAGAAAVRNVASTLAELCRSAGAPLFINSGNADAIEVAMSVGAGLHLTEEAKAVAGLVHGRSCHDAAGLARAVGEGAAFATLGPLGPVPEKNAPITLDVFEGLTRATEVAVFALGGVHPGNVAELVRRGARGVAVMRAVYRSVDPEAAVAELVAALDEGETTCATR